MLRLEAVSKRYGRAAPVLTGVDLELTAGQVVAIKGGNGSGKSTLLRIVVGLSSPSTGIVTGRPESIGYVPERFPPDERLSAAAYLLHMGRIRGLTTRVASRRAARLCDRLGLIGDASAPLQRLSKGNAQKVAVAQALLVAPQLLVLDEPWSGLDSTAHGVLNELVTEAAGSGAAVLFTDHGDALTSAGASVGYELTGGCLRPRPGASGQRHVVSEVVLAAPVTGPAPRRVQWSALPGVLDTCHEGDTVTVRVADAHRDALLLAALRRGWSVTELRRAAASAQPPESGAR